MPNQYSKLSTAINGGGGGGGGGTPGGPDGAVQFNNGGAFDGDSGFTYSLGGDVVVNTALITNLISTNTGDLTLESDSGNILAPGENLQDLNTLSFNNGDIAQSGVIRLSNNDSIEWRNISNTADVGVTYQGYQDTLVIDAGRITIGASPATIGSIGLTANTEIVWRSGVNPSVNGVNLNVDNSDSMIISPSGAALTAPFLSQFNRNEFFAGTTSDANRGILIRQPNPYTAWHVGPFDTSLNNSLEIAGGYAVLRFNPDVTTGVLNLALDNSGNPAGDPSLTIGTNHGAQSGVLRLPNNKAMAWRNAANSADLPLVVDGSNNLTFNGSPIGVSFPLTSPTSNPATAGQLRLANNESIDWRNNANTANASIRVNNVDRLEFFNGASPTGMNIIGDLAIGGATVGDVFNKFIYINQNSASLPYNVSWAMGIPGDTNSIVFKTTTPSNFDILTLNELGGGTAGLTLNGVSPVLTIGTTASAISGAINLPNSNSINWRNGANTGDEGLTMNSSDQLVTDVPILLQDGITTAPGIGFLSDSRAGLRFDSGSGGVVVTSGGVDIATFFQAGSEHNIANSYQNNNKIDLNYNGNSNNDMAISPNGNLYLFTNNQAVNNLLLSYNGNTGSTPLTQVQTPLMLEGTTMVQHHSGPEVGKYTTSNTLTGLSIYTEENVTVGAAVQTGYLLVNINGTEYKLLLG